MPKLTDAHVNPAKIAKMKVSCCTQAISRTTAVALNLIARSGIVLDIGGVKLQLPEKATATATCFEFCDDLFDSLNSVGGSPKEVRKPVTEGSKHMEFWNEAIPKLEKMYF